MNKTNIIRPYLSYHCIFIILFIISCSTNVDKYMEITTYTNKDQSPPMYPNGAVGFAKDYGIALHKSLHSRNLDSINKIETEIIVYLSKEGVATISTGSKNLNKIDSALVDAGRLLKAFIPAKIHNEPVSIYWKMPIRYNITSSRIN